MTRPLRNIKPAISYSIPEAAFAVGCGETQIRAAIGAGQLEQHFLTPKKPVVLFDDLVAWVSSCDTEKAS